MLNWHENVKDNKGTGSSQTSDSGAWVYCRIIHLSRDGGGGNICRGVDKFLMTHAKFESLWEIIMGHIHWAAGYRFLGPEV